MEPLFIASSFLFGREVMSQTVTNSTRTILGGVSSILEDEDFLFKKILMDYDLVSKVKIIDSYINEIMCVDNDLTKQAIKLCIQGISEILIKIDKEVQTIKEKIKEHTELWFHRFRTPEYKGLLINLENDIRILSERFDLLIKIKN
jgi:hypothetical protein